MSVSDNVEQKFREDILKLGYKLCYVEYVKEGPDNILRFFIDVDREEGINFDDCVLVSKFLDPALDEVDLVPDEYILEVSSLGAERELRNEEDLNENLEAYVMVHLYQKFEGDKVHSGHLKENHEDKLVILNRKNKKLTIEKKLISKIHLCVEI